MMCRSYLPLALAALSCVVAGCATPLPESLEKPVVPAFWREAPPAAGSSEVQHERWWHAYGSDALDRLVQQALEQNLSVHAADHRLAAAHTLNASAWAAIWPTASIGVQGARDASARDNFMHMGVDVAWPLTLPVERQALYRLAQGQIAAELGEQQSVHAAVAAEVVRSWLQARYVAQRLQIERRAWASENAAITYLEHRVKAGLLTDDVLLAARSEADSRRRKIVASESTLHDLAQALAILLGRHTPEPSWTTFDEPQPGGPPCMVAAMGDRLPTAWLAGRPEVAIARAQVLRAAGDVGMAQAALYPRVMLGMSWIYAKNISRDRRHANESQPMISPFVDLPIWDWGMRRATRDAQAHALKAALASYHAVLLNAYGETEVALRGLSASRELGALARAQDERAALVWRRAQVGVRAGIVDPIDAQAHYRAYCDAQGALAAQALNEHLAFAALHRHRSLEAAP